MQAGKNIFVFLLYRFDCIAHRLLKYLHHISMVIDETHFKIHLRQL